MKQFSPAGCHNGWRNFETWAVRAWIEFEAPSRRYWAEQARLWHGRDQAAAHLAEQLEAELTGDPPDGVDPWFGHGGSLVQFLEGMGAAVEAVDWLAIAENYLSNVTDEDPAP